MGQRNMLGGPIWKRAKDAPPIGCYYWNRQHIKLLARPFPACGLRFACCLNIGSVANHFAGALKVSGIARQLLCTYMGGQSIWRDRSKDRDEGSNLAAIQRGLHMIGKFVGDVVWVNNISVITDLQRTPVKASNATRMIAPCDTCAKSQFFGCMHIRAREFELAIYLAQPISPLGFLCFGLQMVQVEKGICLCETRGL